MHFANRVCEIGITFQELSFSAGQEFFTWPSFSGQSFLFFLFLKIINK